MVKKLKIANMNGWKDLEKPERNLPTGQGDENRADTAGYWEEDQNFCRLPFLVCDPGQAPEPIWPLNFFL